MIEADFDTELLLSSPIPTYRRRDYFDEDVERCKLLGYNHYLLDCSKPSSSEELHEAVRSSFHFSEYYGCNLNALIDCLESDLDCGKRGRALLAFEAFDAYLKRNRDEAIGILDAIVRAHREHLVNGVRLMTFLRCDDPAFEISGLGLFQTWWNPRECLTRIAAFKRRSELPRPD